MQTQNDMILQHLRRFGSITPREALELFYDLKRQGFDIRTGRETARNRFGEPVRYARYMMGGVT